MSLVDFLGKVNELDRMPPKLNSLEEIHPKSDKLEDPCPECGSYDMAKKKEHKFSNHLFSILVGVAAGKILKNVEFGGFVGVMAYSLNMPFGAKIKYSCNQCNNHWEES